MKTAGILTGTFGFVAVALGAFGAHALRVRLAPEMLDIWHTAVAYQFYHTFAMGMALLLHERRPSRALRLALVLFAGGIIVFSGSLYLLAVTGAGWLGAITPVGGLAFLAGWLCLAASLTNKSTVY